MSACNSFTMVIRPRTKPRVVPSVLGIEIPPSLPLIVLPPESLGHSPDLSHTHAATMLQRWCRRRRRRQRVRRQRFALSRMTSWTTNIPRSAIKTSRFRIGLKALLHTENDNIMGCYLPIASRSTTFWGVDMVCRHARENRFGSSRCPRSITPQQSKHPVA